jgi:nucleotide-binding universal stress UspA family protein
MRVIAALDDSDRAAPVAAFAGALARVLGADVDGLHIAVDGVERVEAVGREAGLSVRVERGDVCDSLRHEAQADDVGAVVLGRTRDPQRGPAGATALELLTTLPKPVVVVPADAPRPGRLGRILVPLEGTRSTSLAPRRTIQFAQGAGVEIVLLHVLDEASLPLFTDQPQHETAAWTSEFLARYAPCPPETMRLESRVGDPVEEIVAVAREIDADVVVLGWAQELSAGRAPVVRATLEQAKLPVFLIPVFSLDGELVATAPLAGHGTEEP